MSQTRPAVTFDSAEPAAEARSILGYPGDARLVVEGVVDVLEGAGALGVEDVDGEPTFACLPESALAPGGRRPEQRPAHPGQRPGRNRGRRSGPPPSPSPPGAGRSSSSGCRSSTSAPPSTCSTGGTSGGPSSTPTSATSRSSGRAASRRTGTPYYYIAAVALADLHRDRVEVRWVDPTGAHHAVRPFQDNPRARPRSWAGGCAGSWTRGCAD